MKKMNRIGQIVKLRQFVKKWKTRAQDSPSTTGCSLSPRSKHSSSFSYDSEEECCRRPAAPPPDVPEGYLAVYVGRKGEDRTRFIIPTAYLTHPFFRSLLDKAEEEFGFDHQGRGLTIPCEAKASDSFPLYSFGFKNLML
ncbi:hypothetical protein SUGI_0130600 [Cryptomeria japonica]|nr:hypothetical protein SUGI_0130600 [Cryptomeria japonica]